MIKPNTEALDQLNQSETATEEKPEEGVIEAGEQTDAEKETAPSPTEEKTDEIEDRTVEEVDVRTAESEGLTQDSVDKLLEKLNLDSEEDLFDILDEHRDMQGRLGSLNLEELTEKAAALDELKAKEELEKRLKLEQEEDPDETIARLKREMKEQDRKYNQDKQRQAEQAEANKLVRAYDKQVKEVIEADSDLPPELQKLAVKMFSSSNPANALDIGDKRAVRKMLRSETANLKKFAQGIIEAYNSGKKVVPTVSETKTTPTAQTPPAKAKNIQEANKVAIERLTAML